jgi:hypothetical protein
MITEKPTSFQIPRDYRTRMKKVAVAEGFPTMISWLKSKIEESENKLL